MEVSHSPLMKRFQNKLLFVCLLVGFRHVRRHIGTSPLQIKGFKIWAYASYKMCMYPKLTQVGNAMYIASHIIQKFNDLAHFTFQMEQKTNNPITSWIINVMLV